MLWYGYRYKHSGEYQVKRYFDVFDISELEDVVGDTIYWFYPYPFRAKSRQEAIDCLIDLDWSLHLSQNCGIEPLQTLGTRTLNREIIEDTSEDLIDNLKNIINNKRDKNDRLQ